MNRCLTRQTALAGVLAVLAVAATSFSGCGANAPASPLAEVVPQSPDDDLRETLDDAIEQVFEQRTLSLERHAAWQILHGVLAYGQEFLVQDPATGKETPAVEHLLNGGAMRGWDVRPGIMFDNGRQGLRVEMDVGSKAGQGHPDQWFAVLAQSGLPANTELKVQGKTFTMNDILSQMQYEAPRNVTAEYSWTIIGLTAYLPTTSTWQAVDGQTWSIDRIAEIELEHELNSSACGGTHRLIGLAMARNRRTLEQAPMERVWERVETQLAASVERAKQLQNPDGSFSTRYFARPSSSPDLAQNLGATGHILEFLAVTLPDDRLREPWVQRSVVYLCELLKRTEEIPLECGALYHAVHGLVLYRNRIRDMGATPRPIAQ